MKKAVFLSIFSALLLVLSFPKPDLGFLAWVALVPWLFALQKKTSRETFLLSYLVGLVFFSGVLYWVALVSSLGFSVLIIYLAIYFGLFGLLASRFAIGEVRFTMLAIPCLWVALEYIRSHLFTGFGWALLGYSQYKFLPAIQISDLTGAYGVSFLVCLVNVGIWRLLSLSLLAPKASCVIARSERSERRSNDEKMTFAGNDLTYAIICTLFFISLALGYGYYRLYQRSEGDNVKIAVVQGNIPQKMKWDPKAQEDILATYSQLTRQAAKDKPQIIIWPETSVPGFLEDEAELLREILSLSKRVSPAYLLLGVPHAGEDEKIYNSAILLHQGEIIQRYDKLHLVPFGEFIPGARFFSRFSFAELIGDFHPGKVYTVFDLKPDLKLSALICFEDVFGYLSRGFTRKGAQILVNMTNDAWFEDSSEPHQHLQASVFRAVENRVSVVRSANTGVSCFINPWGKVEARVADELGKEVLVAGAKTHEVTIARLSSIYTASGDIFAWLCLLLFTTTILRDVVRIVRDTVLLKSKTVSP